MLTPSGYLTLKIPNNEVKTVYADVMSNWIIEDAELTNQELYELKDAILSNNKIKIENILNEALNHISFMDSGENFYHGYVLGLFVNFLNREYIVKSNREAGEGRFDIMIEAVNRTKGIIVEFKVAKDDEDLEEKARIGKEQIQEKQYYKELELDRIENIITYSIAFKGKRCKVI